MEQIADIDLRVSLVISLVLVGPRMSFTFFNKLKSSYIMVSHVIYSLQNSFYVKKNGCICARNTQLNYLHPQSIVSLYISIQLINVETILYLYRFMFDFTSTRLC